MDKLPGIHARGGMLYADLRHWSGQRHTALGLAVGSPDLAIGMMAQRKIDELRLCSRVGVPELPLGDPSLTFAGLVDRYLDGRDYDSDGGAKYVAAYCKQLKSDLGHLPVAAFAAPDGEVVLRSWRDRMWERGLSNRTTKNRLCMAAAVLRWGRKSGRRLTGPLPDLPEAVRRGQKLSNPIFDFWTEEDFRTLHDHWADEGLRTGRFMVKQRDPDKVRDLVARRSLALSAAFYLGLHDEDVWKLTGGMLRTTFGRYDRYNTKSAASVEMATFDMPERFKLDCEAELARLGRPWGPDELVTGGPWPTYTKVLERATKRLFPDGDRKPFTMRLARRSTVREYTLRGWRTHEIAAILGHVDERMISNIYRRCVELGLVSPVRVPWTCRSGPKGEPTRTGRILAFR